MTIAIGISAVLSLTLIPMIAARVLKSGHQGDSSRVARISTRAFGKLQTRYLKAFDSTLRHRKLVGFLTIASIGIAVIDRDCFIPDNLVIGEDPVADAERFFRTESGITLVTRDMLRKLH